jgi:hypothetical protein
VLAKNNLNTVLLNIIGIIIGVSGIIGVIAMDGVMDINVIGHTIMHVLGGKDTIMVTGIVNVGAIDGPGDGVIITRPNMDIIVMEVGSDIGNLITVSLIAIFKKL